MKPLLFALFVVGAGTSSAWSVFFLRVRKEIMVVQACVSAVTTEPKGSDSI